MSLLIFAFIVIIVLALICWLIQSAPFADARLKWIMQALAVLMAVLVICQRAGLISG